MKIIKYTLTLYLLFFALSLLAGLEDILVKPDKPIVGEPFYVTFRVTAENLESLPFVNFDYGELELISRDVLLVDKKRVLRGAQTRMENLYDIRYTFISKSRADHRLKEIEVISATEEKKFDTLSLALRNSGERSPRVLIESEYSKTKNLYVGEGFSIRHYLYYRDVNITQWIPKKYPVLKDFIKRFQVDPKAKSERVTLADAEYYRLEVYRAKAFPNKKGRLYLDPIFLELDFNEIGKGNSSQRNFVVSSKMITVDVNELPSELTKTYPNLLVGKFSLKTEISSRKVKVDDPIYVTLTIEGDGELESLLVPTLALPSFIESFDTKSEFLELSPVKAQRKLIYTLLGKQSGTTSPFTVKIPYFDPENTELKMLEAHIPSFMIEAEVAQPNLEQNNAPSSKNLELRFTSKNSRVFLYLTLLNITLVSLVLILLFSKLLKIHQTYESMKIKNIYKKLRRGEVTYTHSYKLLVEILVMHKCFNEALGLKENLHKLMMDTVEVENLIQILNVLEKAQYGGDEGEPPMKNIPVPLKQFYRKYSRRPRDENPS